MQALDELAPCSRKALSLETVEAEFLPKGITSHRFMEALRFWKDVGRPGETLHVWGAKDEAKCMADPTISVCPYPVKGSCWGRESSLQKIAFVVLGKERVHLLNL